MRVIDAHAHIISLDAITELQRALPDAAPRVEQRGDETWIVFPSGRESGPIPTGMTHLPTRLSDMDAAGITTQLLSPPPPFFGYRLELHEAVVQARIVNDASIAVAATDEHRFGVLATLPLRSPVEAVAELDRVWSTPSVVGVEVGANAGGLALDDPSLEPVWAALDDRAAIVLVHPAPADAPQYARHFTRNLVGNPADSTLAIANIIFSGMPDRFPSIRWVFVHGGGFAPYQIGRWDHAWRSRSSLARHIDRPPSEYLRGFYFDSLTHDHDALTLLADRVGWDHVVLGSDYLFDMADANPAAGVRAHELDHSTEMAVLGGTLNELMDGVLRVPRERHSG